MTTRIRHKMIAALVVSMAIVALLGLLAFYFVRDVVEASRFASHSQQVLFFIQRARTLHVEAQLEDLKSAALNDSTSEASNQLLMERMCNALDSLVSDNASQRAIVARLRTAERSSDLAAISQAQESFDDVLDEMQRAENQLKRDRQAAMTRQFYNFIAASVALLAVWIANILVLLVVLNRNLRQRDNAEMKVSLAASEIKRLYEDAPCGYFTVNEDGIVIKVNQTLQRWLGYNGDEIADRMHVADLLAADDKPGVRRVLLEEKLTGGELEVALARSTGDLVPAILTFSRVSRNGTHPVYLCSVVDNTERRKAEDETKRAYKELESFSYSVSHDLRAPLRSINGYGQILMEDYGDVMDDEGRRVVAVIINNGKRMGQLIDDLLDFSRMSRKEISRSIINMNEFVGTLAAELLEREQDRKVDLKVMDLVEAHGDVSMLRQVWINLISNALKYSRKKETAAIEIGCIAHGQEVVYFIKDNGAGFSMDYYDKLFGVFQRLHKIQDFEGTGVGLALVKRIIERHGGKIWAEAKLNEGATFYYSMPCIAAAVPHLQTVSS